MKKFSQPTIIVVVLILLLTACGPPSAEKIVSTETKQAANITKTQTAAAPTATLVPTPSPTPTPTPLPTPTPTPLPDPDASAMINWEALNLPSSYSSLDPYEFGFGMGELIMWAEPDGGPRVDYFIENSFIFAKEWPEAAYGWTVLFPTETDQGVLNWYIDNFADQLGGIVTNVFQANMISLIDDSEYSDLGDNSAEAWAIYEYGGTWWVFWGSVFRMGDIGGFVFLRHSFGDEPFIFIGDLAKTYAQSIETPSSSCRLDSVFWDTDFDIPAYQYVAQGFYPGEPLIIALTGDVMIGGEAQGVTIVDDETDSADNNGEFYGRAMFLVDLIEVEVEEILPSEFELMIIGYFSGCKVTYSSVWPPEMEEKEPVTLTVLIHQHPPLVEYMEAFNARFEEAYPYVTVDMSVVNAGDLATVTQTRLTANAIDVIVMPGFANAAQPYMVDVVPPNWQTLIEAGLLMDLSGQSFLGNYFDAAIETGAYDGGVYQIPVGTTIYSGVFYNKAMFADYGLEVPTTWDELVAVCETFTDNDIPCMTAGGADGWPIYVGAYGLIGSLFPDQYALVEGLWNGDIKWNDATAIEMWEKMQVYARDMLEEGSSGLTHDGAASRFASGAVAMLPMGSWNASMIEAVDPEMDWGYFPFPGSDDLAENQYWFGKYDMGLSIAANSENSEEALAYLAMLSDPDEYQDFVNLVQFIPTQPTATLDTRIGAELAPYMGNFRIGYEQIWVAPTGTGQWANPWASYFQPFNVWDDPQALADQAQADLQAGLVTVKP